jgi:parallel beta-helix repeat protein
MVVHPSKGASFHDSTNITFEECRIDVSNGNGLYFYNCSEILFSDSMVTRCSNSAIRLVYSWNLSLIDTNLSDNTEGLSAYGVASMDLIGCRFLGNEMFGCDFDYTWDITIDGTDYIENSYGIEVYSSLDHLMINCSFIDNDHAIEYSNTDSVIFKNLSLRRNLYTDIYFRECAEVLFAELNISTMNSGIVISDSNSIECIDCDIISYDLDHEITWDTIRGLEASDCQNLVFSEMRIRRCDYGMDLENCDECRINDTTIEDCINGIYLTNCDYNEVVGVDIYFYPELEPSEVYGIKVQNGHYNLFNDFNIWSPTAPGTGPITYSIFNVGYYNMYVNGSVWNTYYGIYVGSDSHSAEVYDIFFESCVYGSKDYGVMNQYRYCTYSNCFYGSVMSPKSDKKTQQNQIKECDFFNNYIGLKTEGEYEKWMDIEQCRFEENKFGVMLGQEQNGKFSGNTLIDNGYGLYFSGGGYLTSESKIEVEYPGTNLSLFPQPNGFTFTSPTDVRNYFGPEIKDNNFIRNEYQNNLYREIDNDLISENFYSDYYGEDTNGDGYGDTDLPASYCDRTPRIIPYDETDSDNDGFNDLTEELTGSNQYNATLIPRDTNNDGIPDGLRQGAPPTNGGKDDDTEGDDEDDGRSRTTMIPASMRMLILLVLIGFIIIVAFIYFKKYRDEGAVRRKKRAGGKRTKRRKKTG